MLFERTLQRTALDGRLSAKRDPLSCLYTTLLVDSTCTTLALPATATVAVLQTLAFSLPLLLLLLPLVGAADCSDAFLLLRRLVRREKKDLILRSRGIFSVVVLFRKNLEILVE